MVKQKFKISDTIANLSFAMFLVLLLVFEISQINFGKEQGPINRLADNEAPPLTAHIFVRILRHQMIWADTVSDGYRGGGQIMNQQIITARRITGHPVNRLL